MTDTSRPFEHAMLDRARREHGYCVDDMARVLVVPTREPDPDRRAQWIWRGSAMRLPGRRPGSRRQLPQPDGLRRAVEDEPDTGDAGGGALGRWAPRPPQAHSADRRLGGDSVRARRSQRSPSPRAMAFAALGAAEVLAVDPDHVEALGAAHSLRRGRCGVPRERPGLAVAGGAAGLRQRRSRRGDDRGRAAALGDAALRRRGLDLLGWLVELETADGHLSVTPVGRPCAPATPGRRSTSSRSRSPPWPTRARAPRPSIREPGVARGVARPRRGSRATTTADGDVRPGDRRRFRRPRRRTASTPTRAPSRRSPGSSTLQHARRFSAVCRNDFDA